jgi:hypothetical protein
MSTPIVPEPFEFYAWREVVVVDGRARAVDTFDPVCDEFNLFEVEFVSPGDALQFLDDFLEEHPDNYVLVHFTATTVDLSALNP